MKYAIIVILSLLLGFGISEQYFNKVQEIVKIDTLTVIPEPVIVERISPKIIYKSDTIIKTKPFTAMVDTIFKRDTIKVRYDFPENNMKIAIKMATDTVYNSHLSIVEDSKENNWWEKPTIFAGGVLLGILITNTVK